jgi:hypothetical protein
LFAVSWSELAVLALGLAVVGGLVAVPIVGVVLWAKRKR